MSYSSEHKLTVKNKIVESARVLFNRHGFKDVTIDMVMQHSGLTRGGFYNHFKSKEALYSEAVSCFLMGRGAKWRFDAGVDVGNPNQEMSKRMIKSYLSSEHLTDIDGQCPMIALPSDVERSNPEVRASYQKLLESMVSMFELGMNDHQDKQRRQKALSITALCVGGMILAKTLPDSALAKEVQNAARLAANELT